MKKPPADSPQSRASFKRAYRISAGIFSGIAGLSAIARISNQTELPSGLWFLPPLIVFLWLPFFLKGGFDAHFRTAWALSILMFLLTGSGQVLMAVGFWKNLGEGPKGEGAPGAFIIAMVMFALLFFCPWLLTAMRGGKAWRSTKKPRQP